MKFDGGAHVRHLFSEESQRATAADWQEIAAALAAQARHNPAAAWLLRELQAQVPELASADGATEAARDEVAVEPLSRAA